jgi:catechol 2,3-dioxygenase-like lactoylglutathione lyase family enzyme
METMRFGLTGIYVDDQDQAEDIYTEALGLQVKTNAPSRVIESARGRWRAVNRPPGRARARRGGLHALTACPERGAGCANREIRRSLPVHPTPSEVASSW